MTRRLLAALGEELRVVEGAAGEWTVETALEGRCPQCLAVHRDRPQRVVCGTFDDGLWRSEDGGETWSRTGDAVEQARITAVAVDPADPDVVYVGTEPSRVYRSTDGGETWSPRPGLLDLPSAPDWGYPVRPDTHHVRWLAPGVGEDGRLLVAVEWGGLVTSPDGGGTWVDRRPGTPFDVHTIRRHPADADRVLLAAGDGMMRTGRGVWESEDGGETWTRPAAGLDHHYGWSLAVDPTDPGTAVASMASSQLNMHDPRLAEAYVYRRVGGGDWERSSGGLPDPVGTMEPTLAADPDGDGRFYALTNHGLFETVDAGGHWDRLDVGGRWGTLDSCMETTVRALRALA